MSDRIFLRVKETGEKQEYNSKEEAYKHALELFGWELIEEVSA